ncbi:MAG: NUDIX hydrolase [Candidatus Taylorbacteria bacterium]|nr:NUDIX hydrolase [Candidatus Taylorbacteria bacterium]
MQKITRISSKTVFQHPRLIIVEDKIKLVNGAIVPYLRFAGHNYGGVSVLCTKNNHILVQKEYSYPVNKILYQLPGGKIEPKETPLRAAIRELAEESGYKASMKTLLGWYYPNARRSNAKMFVFHFDKVEKINKTKGDEEEDIESFWISIEELESLFRRRKITNYSLLAAWTLFLTKK